MVEFDFDPAWFGDIKANTLENHRKRLEVLYENLPGVDLANDMDRVIEFVEARYDAPFNVYATLRKVLRATAPTSKGMEILRKRPTAKHRKRGKFLGRKKSPIEEKLWVEWPVIERATAALYKKVKRDPKKATKHDLTDLLMLGLYVYADPRRNDYHNMKMGRGHQEDTNYCDLVGRTFVFNDYKTSKFYKQQNIAIQPRLVKIIRWYHDRYGHAYLVAPTSLSTSQFTDRMKATTRRRFGKPLSSRILRKIYITFKNLVPLREMLQRAKNMGHNFRQSLDYIRV